MYGIPAQKKIEKMEQISGLTVHRVSEEIITEKSFVKNRYSIN